MSDKRKKLQDILLVNSNVLSSIGRMVYFGDEGTATLERIAHFFPNDVVLIKNIGMVEKIKK